MGEHPSALSPQSVISFTMVFTLTSFSVWLIVFASGSTESAVPHGMIASKPGSEYVTSHIDNSGAQIGW